MVIMYFGLILNTAMDRHREKLLYLSEASLNTADFYSSHTEAWTLDLN